MENANLMKPLDYQRTQQDSNKNIIKMIKIRSNKCSFVPKIEGIEGISSNFMLTELKSFVVDDIVFR